MKKKESKYNFNICLECQERNKDVPCNETCRYLKEYKDYLKLECKSNA